MTLEVRVTNHVAQSLIPKAWLSKWRDSQKLLFR